MTLAATLAGVLGNRCPKCGIGPVFKGFYRMHKACSTCSLVFEREPGYFMGAAVLTYIIGTFSTVPTIVALVFLGEVPWVTVLVVASIQVIFLNPFLFKYSRLVWLYADYGNDP